MLLTLANVQVLVLRKALKLVARVISKFASLTVMSLTTASTFFAVTTSPWASTLKQNKGLIATLFLLYFSKKLVQNCNELLVTSKAG